MSFNPDNPIDPASVTEWFIDAKKGDDEAVAKLWYRYFEQLIGLARHRLGSQRRMADEEDVVSAALTAFFQAIQNGRYDQLRDRQDIWRLLLEITENKARDQLKHERRKKRGGGQVRGHSVMENPDASDVGFNECPDPTPEFVDEFIASCDWLHRLGDDLRQFALWKLAGRTNKEIAEELGKSEEFVRKKVDKIKKELGHDCLATRLPEDLVQIEIWRRFDKLSKDEIAERVGILVSSVERKFKIIDQRLGRNP